RSDPWRSPINASRGVGPAEDPPAHRPGGAAPTSPRRPVIPSRYTLLLSTLLVALLASASAGGEARTPFAPDGVWSMRSREANHPPHRAGHAAVYDPAHRRMVVFGGIDLNATNDVYAMSLAT